MDDGLLVQIGIVIPPIPPLLGILIAFSPFRVLILLRLCIPLVVALRLIIWCTCFIAVGGLPCWGWFPCSLFYGQRVVHQFVVPAIIPSPRVPAGVVWEPVWLGTLIPPALPRPTLILTVVFSRMPQMSVIIMTMGRPTGVSNRPVIIIRTSAVVCIA